MYLENIFQKDLLFPHTNVETGDITSITNLTC